ncbi:MAG: hypothetical protein HY290_32380 [Planctomycetia bacterium]|nr:hypothetical protein [Planctomycetia bacterium]
MERVHGIGGFFLRAREPDVLARWYCDYLGVDLTAMMSQLQDAGIAVEVDPGVYRNGLFARLQDPEGNPIQLWEPRGNDTIR